jgi:hypothetical protein
MTRIKTIHMEDDERVRAGIRRLRSAATAGTAFAARTTQNDRDHGFRDKPVLLLNRIARSISASHQSE